MHTNNNDKNAIMQKLMREVGQGSLAKILQTSCLTCLFIADAMSPNAVFEYAGDRDVLDEDITKDIEIEEEVLSKQWVVILALFFYCTKTPIMFSKYVPMYQAVHVFLIGRLEMLLMCY